MNHGGADDAATIQSRRPGNGFHAPAKVVYVVGGAEPPDDIDHASGTFPLLYPRDGEAPAAHLLRVAHRIEGVMSEGATHLLVPRDVADWLGDHPLLADFLSARHALEHACVDAGVTFALRPQPAAWFTLEVEGWQFESGEGIALTAPHRLIAPRVLLRPSASVRGAASGTIALRAEKVTTLRIAFEQSRTDRRHPFQREIICSLARPGFVMHDVPFAEVTFADDGAVVIAFDLKINQGRSLESIMIEIIEEDNWRMHPNYPGGAKVALPAIAPAGARLELHGVHLETASRVRKGPSHGIVRGALPTAYRKAQERPRDAVIFSSWVPEEGLALGDYFLQTLCRWHADSKIFVGINHGSSPRWRQRIEASGLEVAIQQAPSSMTMPFDPTGFVAALDAFRRDPEPFDLVWFGHNKGGDHLDEGWYATARWTIERMFWSRREAIEQHFQNPSIGLSSPHYLMLLQDHLRQTDALQRMYQATCRPLGAMAVSAHFVMREEIVRAFCAKVDPRFFTLGPELFGGDRYFFEMAMPNVAAMQGYDPFIEPGLGGTHGPPKLNGVASILNDWRQNNAVTAIELQKWKARPTRFRTLHCEHNREE